MPAENTSLQPGEQGLTDLFSRSISYLRISLTDRCNLRCLYCVTEEESEGRVSKLHHADLLSYEEILRVAGIAVPMGIRKIRITGGEPLTRRGVLGFIRRLARIDGLDDIRLTTNGVLLKEAAPELYGAGVRKVNISLDSLLPGRFAKITGADRFAQVREGMMAALGLGFTVKLNMVVMRHINDDEILEFARLSQRLPLQVRFIEFMPIGHSSRWRRDVYVSNDELMDRISALGPLLAQGEKTGDGPARIFRLGTESPGTLGFISPLSHHFCARCNRLRLTSSGGLRSCLLCDREIDLRALLRQERDDAPIRAALLEAVRNKPERHLLEAQTPRGGTCHGLMSRIGG